METLVSASFLIRPNPTNSVAKIVAYGSAKNGWKYTLGTNFVPCNPAAFGSTSNTYNTREYECVLPYQLYAGSCTRADIEPNRCFRLQETR